MTALSRLLVRRFGPLSVEVEKRLHNAAASELERWLENVLDAKTLDEVFTVH